MEIEILKNLSLLSPKCEKARKYRGLFAQKWRHCYG